MKIAVYGATGRVGSAVVREAAERGHHVLALSRNEGTADLPDAVGWQAGDVTEAEGVRTVAAGVDAVVSAIGPDRGGAGSEDFGGVVTGLADAVADSHGDARLVVVGGAGSLLERPGFRLVDSPDFPGDYKGEALAQADALEALRSREDDLDWTYLSPSPVIDEGPRTGQYLVGKDVPVGAYVSFADYAVALVDDLETPTHKGQRWTVASQQQL